MDLQSFLIFDTLSGLSGAVITFFTLVLSVYSFGFIKERKAYYYVWFLLSFIAALGVVFSQNLIIVLIFWGFLGFTFFNLINLYDDDKVSAISKKAMIIIGGSDGFLILGFLIYAVEKTSFYFGQPLSLQGNPLALTAFIFVCIGSFAKAGAMPFHTWIPDTCESAPVPVVAFLPSVLDKLLGIYLLVRAVQDMFVLDVIAKSILLVVGGITIISAVMMALVQHNIRKLLGFHAISQVGYMVLGIGCGNPLGLAGGLFHMINNVIYKSCLFLGAGNVEKETGETDLDNLGGLAKFMPFTFVSMLIAALSISGIPPLNGFVSKWMIYQGAVDLVSNSVSFPLKAIAVWALILALIGSGLTLASFIKVISGVFLGSAKKKFKEARFILYAPAVLLSIVCVVLGIFFHELAVPVLTKITGKFSFTGLWKPELSTLLILSGLVLGLVFFKIMAGKVRYTGSFTGGMDLSPEEEARAGDFYGNFRQMPLFRRLYSAAEKKWFDIYEQVLKLVFSLIRVLRYLHNGILPTYLVWCLLGMLGLFVAFFKIKFLCCF